MKDFIKRLWIGIDSYAFNVTAIVICAIGAFFGMAIGFAGFWYGWLILAYCLAAAIFFIRDLNRVHSIVQSKKATAK